MAYVWGAEREKHRVRNLRENKLGKFSRVLQQQNWFSEKCFQERMR